MAKENHRPELIIIAGPNGSGKTSVTQKFLHHEWAEGIIYINPDLIAKEMFGDWNDSQAVLKAANHCADLREQCLSQKKSFVFETVFSAKDKIDFVLRAKKADFFVRIFFISTCSPTINAARIAKRVIEGGHDVPISKIVSRYQKSILNCLSVSKEVDRLYVYDNSVDDVDARPLFRLSSGCLAKKYSDNIPEWAALLLPTPDGTDGDRTAGLTAATGGIEPPASAPQTPPGTSGSNLQDCQRPRTITDINS